MALRLEAVQMPPAASPPLDQRSKELRRLAVRALHGGERGHVGSSMSLVEIMRVLYDDILRYRPQQPDWRERDRMILSKGHGCIALYVMLADKGFIPIDTLDTFCRRDSILGGIRKPPRFRALRPRLARSAMGCRSASAWRWQPGSSSATVASSW